MLTPEHMSFYAQDFADIMNNDGEVRDRLAGLGVDLNELDKTIFEASSQPTVESPTEGAASASLGRSARRIGAAQKQLQGFSGYSKPPEDSDATSFNPSELSGPKTSLTYPSCVPVN
jgi:hypothetical protein